MIGALKQTNMFADFSRAVFDESRTLADALDRAFGGSGASAAAIILYVLVRPWPLAWLRASYIKALYTAGTLLPRPTWPSVARLVVLDVCIGTPLAFAIGGLEKADQAALAAPLLLMVLVFTLYADYAIVVDDVTVWQSFRSSLHVVKRRPAALARRHGGLAHVLVRARQRPRPRVRPRRHAAGPDGAAGRSPACSRLRSTCA